MKGPLCGGLTFLLSALLVAACEWSRATEAPMASNGNVDVPRRHVSQIALAPGLTIVTAIHEPSRGDYESIKRIVTVDDRGYLIEYSADVPPAENELGALLGDIFAERSRGRDGEGPQAEQVHARRMVLARDQLTARDYMQYFATQLPDTIPGTTALGVSRDVLIDLRTRGAASITMRNVDVFGRVGPAISGMLRGMAGELAGTLDTSMLDAADRISGTVHRVSAPGTFSLLVDGKPAAVAALTARGTLGDHPVEVVLLDDSGNPLALSWKIGDQHDLRVVQIHWPPTSMTAREPIERQLAETGRAVIYGIYFDFNSDAIKPESEPVLQEIAAALRNHPDWTLTVEGHTDAIGDETFNQALSERRAASVRRALVERYTIGAERLAPAGFGESRPKASNDTLEGRAQNRRVELVRRAATPSSH